MCWNPLVFTLQCCTELSPRLQQQRGRLIHSERKKNTKVSTHQLIIHYAFKASAAAPRHHGNCRLSCHTMAEHHAFGSGSVCVCSDRWGPPRGRKVFSFCCEHGGLLSHMKEGAKACVHAAFMRVLLQTHSLCCLIRPACRRISVFVSTG